ncbi:TPA: NAD-dependent epimerase/dehydratase family protein [Candidatus Woesearchaeota archaeon]|nr:NAD-dependent epimerase/dehydratase family protein [Candidatus Woesearchaeota archaeon]
MPLKGKVLVTGAAGFVGSHLVERLVEKGHEVVCMVFSKDPVNYLPPGMASCSVVGDVRDAAFVERAMQGCSRVFHLAGTLNEPSIPAGEFYSTNVEGTRNVMAAALKFGVEKVVHTSSVATIKENPARVDEEHLFRGVFDGHYSLTKYKSEKVAFEYGARGLNVTVVNPTIIYGPRETHTLGQIFRNYLRPKVRVVGFRDSVLNLIYVKDAVEGFILAMEKGRPGHRYIIGGSEMTLGEFVSLMDEVAGVRKPVVEVPGFVLELGVRVIEPLFSLLRILPPLMRAQVSAMRRGTAVDISKAKRELGLPDRPVRDGLKETLDWYRRTGYIRV